MSWSREDLKSILRKSGCAPLTIALSLGMVIGIILGLPLSQVIDFDDVPGIGEVGCLRVIVRYNPGEVEYTPKIEIFDELEDIRFEKQFITRTSSSDAVRELVWVFYHIPTGSYKATSSSNGEAYPDWTSREPVEVRAYDDGGECACIRFDYLENICGPCGTP